MIHAATPDAVHAAVTATAHLAAPARRWAIDICDTAAAAVIVDAARDLLAVHGATWPADHPIDATAERAITHGPEPEATTYRLPATPQEAAAILHRYARRYAHNRGDHAAAVNTAARTLTAAGIDLDDTRTLDGSIWADGPNAGLTPDEAAEAATSTTPTSG